MGWIALGWAMTLLLCAVSFALIRVGRLSRVSAEEQDLLRRLRKLSMTERPAAVPRNGDSLAARLAEASMLPADACVASLNEELRELEHELSKPQDLHLVAVRIAAFGGLLGGAIAYMGGGAQGTLYSGRTAALAGGAVFFGLLVGGSAEASRRSQTGIAEGRREWVDRLVTLLVGAEGRPSHSGGPSPRARVRSRELSALKRVQRKTPLSSDPSPELEGDRANPAASSRAADDR